MQKLICPSPLLALTVLCIMHSTGTNPASHGARKSEDVKKEKKSIHGVRIEGKQFDSCVQLAISNLVMAALYKIELLNHGNFVTEARTALKTQNRGGGSGDSIECKIKNRKLEVFVSHELRHKNLPTDLLNCPIDTLPYNLFLCQMDIPKDLMDLLPENFCKSSCSHIQLWDTYHRMRGTTVFPAGWEEHMNNSGAEVTRNARDVPSKYAEFEYAKNFGNGLSVQEVEGYIRQKRQHGVLPNPVPRRFVKEFFQTNTLSTGTWTKQARCGDDEWPFAIEDGLPFGLTIHCWGPLGFAGTHTIGSMNRSTLFDCNGQVEMKPPNGTYLIGLSNRINYAEPFNFLVAGVFLCSGQEEWTVVKNESEYDTRNGTGEIVRCSPATIICTLELKLLSFENKTFTTDVRVGCCEAPERLLYSTMTLVPMRLQNQLARSRRPMWLGQSDLTALFFPALPPVDFEKDYYAEPYGGFINSFSLHKENETGVLIFGYTRFNNLSQAVWANQDPVLGIVQASPSQEPETCGDGFIRRLEVQLCLSFLFFARVTVTATCSNSKVLSQSESFVRLGFLSNVTRLPDCNIGAPETFRMDCPPNHLICGIRKVIHYSGNGSFHIPLFGYQHTFICCPVVHTASSICGPGGAVLTVEDAKIDCIAVSGADTECSTTQTFGFTISEEETNGSTVDRSTEDQYGFSTTKRLEVAATASVTSTNSATVSGGIPAVGMAEATSSVAVMVGGSVSRSSESTATSSTTNRMSEAFSFQKAARTEMTMSSSTMTTYTILDGQRALFYDVSKVCGAISLVSEDFIRILTPSIKCEAMTTFEYIFGLRTQDPVIFGPQNFTFFGFGLEIENDTFISPLERGVNWDLISLGVKEKFTNSISLTYENHIAVGGYDFRRSPPGLWMRSTNAIAYNFTFNLEWPMNYRFYRLVGRCGRWRVITNSIWSQKGQDGAYNYLREDADPKLKFEQGQNFRILQV